MCHNTSYQTLSLISFKTKQIDHAPVFGLLYRLLIRSELSRNCRNAANVHNALMHTRCSYWIIIQYSNSFHNILMVPERLQIQWRLKSSIKAKCPKSNINLIKQITALIVEINLTRSILQWILHATFCTTEIFYNITYMHIWPVSPWLYIVVRMQWCI